MAVMGRSPWMSCHFDMIFEILARRGLFIIISHEEEASMNEQTRNKVGHDSQLFGAEVHRLCGGKAEGMQVVVLRNGRGLNVTLAADRCLDPMRLEYKGDNLGFFSPAGWAAPQYYQPEEFLRNFTAGFMTTCGLESVGSDCEDEWEKAVVHGRISNTPAQELCVHTDYSGKQPAMQVSGRMDEAVIFGGKLQLERTVTMPSDDNLLCFHDRVTNLGGEERPLMLLYHFNMGYPLLDEGVELLLPTKEVTPRDARAAQGTDEYDVIPAPEAGFAEQCYYHRLGTDEQHRSCAGIYNEKIGKGVLLHFDTNELDQFTQWKMTGVRDYVLGLEPGNCRVEGRVKCREEGILKTIQPGETVEFHLNIQILDGEADLINARKKIEVMRGVAATK